MTSGQQISPAGVLQIDPSVQAPLSDATHDKPTIKIFPSDVPIALTQAPHYRYRLDYLLPEAQSTQPQQPNPVPPLPGTSASAADRQAALATFNAATGNYQAHNHNHGKEKLIGRNNVSELTFDWAARDAGAGVDSKKAIHTVRWREDIAWADGDTAPDPDIPSTFVKWTTYSVSLDPNDPQYPDKRAAKEGP